MLKRRGFTLVEALAAVLILSVGIVGVYGGLSSLTKAEARARSQDLVQRLAEEKYAEILATTQDIALPDQGNFADRNYPDITWSLDSTPSGVENLQSVTVKVENNAEGSTSPVGEATGLVYIPPANTTGAQP